MRETETLTDALEQIGTRWAVEVFNLGNGSWCCKIHIWQEYGETPALAITRALSGRRRRPGPGGRGGVDGR